MNTQLFRVLRSITSALVLATVYSSIAVGMPDSGGTASASVAGVRRIPIVRIRVVVRNGSSTALVVPQCGVREETPLLCDLATHVEVRSGSTWSKAPLGRQGGILGGTPLSKGIVLGPGEERKFEWEFSEDVFDIGPATIIRLTLDAWAKEDALRSDAPLLRISTDTFKPTQ